MITSSVYLVEIQEVKTYKSVGASQWLGLPEVFNSELFTLSLQQFINAFRFPHSSTGSLRDCCFNKLWFSVFTCWSLQFLEASVSSDFPSLMDLSRVVDFSVCSDLYLLGGGVSSKLFTCQTRYPKFWNNFLKIKFTYHRSHHFIVYESVGFF